MALDAGVGVALAFGALFFWGAGDFLIQKTTRHIGDWETLFLISLFGTAMLAPLAYNSLFAYLSISTNLIVFITVSIIAFVSGIINFEALKMGKITVVEPVISLEVPVVAVLAFLILHEAITPIEMTILAALVVGLGLVSLKSYHFSRKLWVESGVVLAAITAVLLGAYSFLVGFGSRLSNPLVVFWFISFMLMFYTLAYLVAKGKLRKLMHDASKIKSLVISTCMLDNSAWICYAVATVLIPVTIAVGISESFIAFSALLGLVVSRERLLAHQKVGLVVSLASAIALAFLV